ncbi:hypothetical protein AQUCO_00200343v1 [Aquilegia coerulea]|uniref:Ribosomal protein L15 n=1 Tax=Aquilegia coerulea TaxID=218851 RepID=A0A2G5F2V0_AQUCA|nr:hypothetical protein AQUCO_00200343v1 [Aquilegia coerulea]
MRFLQRQGSEKVNVRDLFPKVHTKTYGNPTNQPIIQLKFQKNKRSVAEEHADPKSGGINVLKSYWISDNSTYKYFEIILVDAAHKAIHNDPRINLICKACTQAP